MAESPPYPPVPDAAARIAEHPCAGSKTEGGPESFQNI